MSRRIITPETYLKLLQAYRQFPNNHSHAARLVGCDRATARKGWNDGWPRIGPSIRETLDQEQAFRRAKLWEAEEEAQAIRAAAEAEVRTKLDAADREVLSARADADKTALATVQAAELEAAHKLADAEKSYSERLKAAERDARQKLADLLDKAKLDAAETMATEARISRSARSSVLALYGLAGTILKADNLPMLASIVDTAIKGGAMSPVQAARFLNALGRFVVSINEAGKLALDIERERVGEPTEVIQLQVEQLTTNEALETIDQAKALADLLREEGEATVPPGSNGVH